MNNNTSKRLIDIVTKRHKTIINKLDTRLRKEYSHRRKEHLQELINLNIQRWANDMRKLGLTPLSLYKVKGN